MRTNRVAPQLVRTVAIGVVACLACGVASAAASKQSAKEPNIRSLTVTRPLSFEANLGQVAEPVRFVSRGQNYSLYLTPTESVLSLHRGSRVSGLRVKLVGANAEAKLMGLDPQKGKSNYYVGAPSQWRTGIPHFGRVAYDNVYPNVNLVHYGNEGVLEYDFVVAPGGDPSAIRFSIEGADKIQVDKAGNLVIKTSTGEVVQRSPLVYQDGNGVRATVAGRFVLENKSQVRFELGRYDKQLALVIDPVLSFSTYLGGTANDIGFGIAVDSTGGAYVTGQTASTNFPTVVGAMANAPGNDAFVTRYDYDGQTLLYSTYLGGSSGTESATSIAIEAGCDATIVPGCTAWVGGFTRSSNFPTAGTPFRGTRPGPTGSDDGFVSGFDASGLLIYSSYLGGAVADRVNAIAAVAGGDVYVTGSTSSANFPTTVGAFDTTLNGAPDAFVTRFDGSTSYSSLAYSTYLGGGSTDDGFGIAVDDAGLAYVTGRTSSNAFPTAGNAYQATRKGGPDAFVTILDAAGAPTYSTFLGGTGDDRGFAISINSDTGNPFVTGQTTSTNFPTRSAFQKTNAGGTDVFVTKIVPGAATPADTLAYSTYLGGSGNEFGKGIRVGEFGFAYVAGQTASSDFPTWNAVQPVYGGGTTDAFVSRLSDDGKKLKYSTFLGGFGVDEGNAIDVTRDNTPFAGGNAYVTGRTISTNFLTDSALQPSKAGAAATSDAFVTRLPFVSVDDPFAGAGWATGTFREIRWTNSLQPPETVTLELLDGGTPVFTDTIVSTGSGVYALSVPTFTTSSPDNAEVRMTWNANGAVFGSSGLFDVDAPSLTVKTPSGSSSFCVGETRRLVWRHNLGPFDTYTIELDRDGDATFDETIATGIGGAAFESTYDWVVSPGTDTTAAVIRITSGIVTASDDSAAFDISTCP